MLNLIRLASLIDRLHHTQSLYDDYRRAVDTYLRTVDGDKSNPAAYGHSVGHTRGVMEERRQELSRSLYRLVMERLLTDAEQILLLHLPAAEAETPMDRANRELTNLGREIVRVLRIEDMLNWLTAKLGGAK